MTSKHVCGACEKPGLNRTHTCRAYLEGRAAGLEEAAKFTEDYGLELFGKADLSLRHGTVMLAAFAVKIRGLIPSRTELESFRVTEKEK